MIYAPDRIERDGWPHNLLKGEVISLMQAAGRTRIVLNSIPVVGGNFSIWHRHVFSLDKPSVIMVDRIERDEFNRVISRETSALDDDFSILNKILKMMYRQLYTQLFGE